MKQLMLFLILASCSQLTTQGSRVYVWDDMSPENSNTYVEAGQVSCNNGIIFVTRSTNNRLCEERLRSEAANLGAQVIVIDQVEKPSGFLNSSVKMTATAYKKRQALPEDTLDD